MKYLLFTICILFACGCASKEVRAQRDLERQEKRACDADPACDAEGKARRKQAWSNFLRGFGAGMQNFQVGTPAQSTCIARQSYVDPNYYYVSCN
jgi:hypothetical protein